MSRLILLVAAFILAAPAASLRAAPSDWDQCEADKLSPDTRIAACTRLISAGKQKGSDLAAAYYDRATAEIGKKDYDPAIADLTEAVRLTPKDADSYYMRGYAWSKKGDDDHAIADYDQVIRLTPKSSDAYTSRGDHWFNKGEYDKAVADANQAIKLNPKNSYAFSNRCAALTRKGDLGHALTDCNEAIRLALLKPLDPKDEADCHCRGEMYFNRGRIKELQSNFAAALEDYRAALGLDAKDTFTQEAIKRMQQKLAAVAAPPAANAAPTPVPAASPTTQPAPAASPVGTATQSPLSPPGETRIALVIGNSNYVNAGHLANPKSDAEAMAATLKRVGFTTVTLQLDLTRDKLLDALKNLVHDAERADWAMIYYAGHGLEIGGINYLVPVDAKLSSDREVTFEAIELDRLLQAVDGARKLHIVVLDACRDNPFLKTMTRSMASTRSIGRGLGQIEPEGATLVAYSAKAGSTALDGDGANSPFATALMKNIDTPGIEIGLLFRKVRDDVLGLTGRRQEPFVYGSLPSEAFYFRAP